MLPYFNAETSNQNSSGDRGYKILLVDDESFNRMSLRSILGVIGIKNIQSICKGGKY